jgi:hypothetical protein
LELGAVRIEWNIEVAALTTEVLTELLHCDVGDPTRVGFTAVDDVADVSPADPRTGNVGVLLPRPQHGPYAARAGDHGEGADRRRKCCLDKIIHEVVLLVGPEVVRCI